MNNAGDKTPQILTKAIKLIDYWQTGKLGGIFMSEDNQPRSFDCRYLLPRKSPIDE
ncbi:hypothetical protein [Candidatus Enterococcus huntleyi]|uniref:hypothetical protein n=1 Tax=Candidatus Enterococcus huntleyi TaxID=1857217 RepID=UPI00137AF212|nr:hypothetical protein [Enterococcus sp. JM4C]